MKKGILILGLSGSGKTTLAKRLSLATGMPHLELDTLYWQQGNEPELGEFRERVQSSLTSEPQIIEGHFTKVQDLVLPRVEIILFLDYSLRRILWQSTLRALHTPYRYRHLIWLLRHGPSQRAKLRSVPATHVFRTPSDLEKGTAYLLLTS